MKKLFKVLAVLVGLVILLLVAGSIALRIYLPPEKAKALVLKHLSEQLKREVSLGSVSVGILSGLQMSDLKISEAPNFSKGTFLSSEEFSLKVALLPLLYRKIVVRQILLDQPVVTITRNSDGKTFNFSDLTTKTVAAPSSAASSAPEQKSESLPFLLLVSQAEIQKGALHFIDHSPAHQSMDIAPFDLKLENVSLTSPFSVLASFHLKSKGNDLAFQLNGQANLLDGTFTLKEASLNSRQTKVMVSGILSGLKTLDPDVDLKINIPQLYFADLSAVAPLPPGILIDKPLKGTTTLKGNQKTIEIQSQLSLGSVHLDSRGRIQNVMDKAPYLAFHAETNAFPIAEVLAYAPTMVPPGIVLKGNTQLAADMSGTSTAVQFAVKWNGTDMAIAQEDNFSKAAGIPMDLSLLGNVTSMQPLKVIVKSMLVHLASNELTGSGTYDVHGTQAVINMTAQAVRWSIADLAVVSPLLAPYHPTGNLSFTAHATGLANAPQTTIQSSGNLSIASIKQEFYEGKDMQAQWALTDITPDLARISGTASLKQGPGKILNVEKLAASSKFGKIALAPLDALAKLQQKGVLNQINLPNLQTITFDSITSAYQLHSGIMDIKNFDLLGQALSIGDQGTVGLSGDRSMAMKVAMKLAAGTIGGTVGEILEKDESGRQLIKFTVNGPAANPKVKFDLQDVGKRAVQQAGQELLKNKDVQDAIQNTLKGIFH